MKFSLSCEDCGIAVCVSGSEDFVRNKAFKNVVLEDSFICPECGLLMAKEVDEE